ncbi:MAG: cytoplasmic protein [Serratia sp. (in: enterobacteria)]|uniref:cytoplasmic protein n=1 Tax=Serratia sp. (in: enterobacteria) TaxID=616 RepID=UPI003F32E78C
MRIPENAILSALRNGGCIKSFYRRSVRGAQSVKTPLADGYVLASPGEHGEIILSHADFLSVKTKLAEAETWEHVVGHVLFGGSTWIICPPDIDD